MIPRLTGHQRAGIFYESSEHPEKPVLFHSGSLIRHWPYFRWKLCRLRRCKIRRNHGFQDGQQSPMLSAIHDDMLFLSVKFSISFKFYSAYDTTYQLRVPRHHDFGPAVSPDIDCLPHGVLISYFMACSIAKSTGFSECVPCLGLSYSFKCSIDRHV